MLVSFKRLADFTFYYKMSIFTINKFGLIIFFLLKTCWNLAQNDTNQTKNNTETYKLLFSFLLVRHGIRTPTLYNSTVWKLKEPGELTDKGSEESYKLGKRYQEYFKNISQEYFNDLTDNLRFSPISSDAERCLGSLKSFLKGLLHNTSAENREVIIEREFEVNKITADKNSNYITIQQPFNPFIFHTGSMGVCPYLDSFEIYKKQFYKFTDEEKSFICPIQDYLNNQTDQPYRKKCDVMSPINIFKLWESLFTEAKIDMAAPIFNNESFLNKVQSLAFHVVYDLLQSNAYINKILISKLLSLLKDSIRSNMHVESSSPRLVVIFAHDKTIAPFLSYLLEKKVKSILSEQEALVPFGADLNFEVFRSSEKGPFIKISYLGKEIKPSFCLGRCSLDEFIKVLRGDGRNTVSFYKYCARNHVKDRFAFLSRSLLVQNKKGKAFA
jgi:hypothetical protein